MITEPHNLYIEAPTTPTLEQLNQIVSKSIFLGGGITGCRNWQKEAIDRFRWIEGLYILNPRRAFWDDNDKTQGHHQINWEFEMIERASQIMFWFTKETPQPIVLYELGKEMGYRKACSEEGYGSKPIWVGTDLLYPRAFDVREQLYNIAPDIPIYSSLRGMIDAICTFNEEARVKLSLVARAQ